MSYPLVYSFFSGKYLNLVLMLKMAWLKYYACFSKIVYLFFYAIQNFSSFCTVGDNIIATTKIRNNYGALIINFSNIAIAILDFSLLLLVKLSLFILFASFLVQVNCFFFDGSLFQLSRLRLPLLFANAFKSVKERQLLLSQ